MHEYFNEKLKSIHRSTSIFMRCALAFPFHRTSDSQQVHSVWFGVSIESILPWHLFLFRFPDETKTQTIKWQIDDRSIHKAKRKLISFVESALTTQARRVHLVFLYWIGGVDWLIWSTYIGKWHWNRQQPHFVCFPRCVRGICVSLSMCSGEHAIGMFECIHEYVVASIVRIETACDENR